MVCHPKNHESSLVLSRNSNGSPKHAQNASPSALVQPPQVEPGFFRFARKKDPPKKFPRFARKKVPQKNFPRFARKKSPPKRQRKAKKKKQGENKENVRKKLPQKTTENLRKLLRSTSENYCLIYKGRLGTEAIVHLVSL